MKNRFHKLIIAIYMLMALTILSPRYTNAQEYSLDKLASISADNLQNIELIAEIELANVEDLDWVSSITINMTGDILAIGREKGALSLYDLPSLHLISEFDDHTSEITSLKFSNLDENLLASGSLDTRVMIWDTQALERLSILESDFRGVLDISFHPSKNILAFSKSATVFYPPNNTITVWDIQSMEELGVVEGNNQITILQYSSDGEILVAGDSSGKIIVWDADTYLQLAEIEAHDSLSITDIAFNADSSLLTSVGRDGAINIWDGNNFALIASDIQEGKCSETVSFDVDSKILAVGYSDGTIRILDVESLEQLAAFHAHDYPITQLIFSPKNNFIVTGSSDGTVRFWSVIQDE